jgi:hypothetical protein
MLAPLMERGKDAMRIVPVAAWLVAGMPLQPASNQFAAAGIDNPQSVFKFLADLQQAVSSDDPASVASLVKFPVDVAIGKTRKRLPSSAEFQKAYAQIFDACLKRVVAATKRDDLAASWRGVMLGQGAIWFGVDPDHSIRIFAINGPVDGEPLCQEQ